MFLPVIQNQFNLRGFLFWKVFFESSLKLFSITVLCNLELDGHRNREKRRAGQTYESVAKSVAKIKEIYKF